MIAKYEINVQEDTVKDSLHRLTNQTYKLLPMREEGAEWQPPLNTIMIEISGMQRLLSPFAESRFFELLCKMEGLHSLNNEKDFFDYRRTIFECLNLIADIEKDV